MPAGNARGMAVAGVIGLLWVEFASLRSLLLLGQRTVSIFLLPGQIALFGISGGMAVSGVDGSRWEESFIANLLLSRGVRTVLMSLPWVRSL
jgi:hypothetical protein